MSATSQMHPYLIVRRRSTLRSENFRETEALNRALRELIESALEREGVDADAHFGADMGVAPVLPVECTEEVVTVIRGVKGVEAITEDPKIIVQLAQRSHGSGS